MRSTRFCSSERSSTWRGAQSPPVLSGLGTCFLEPWEPPRPLGCIREWRSGGPTAASHPIFLGPCRCLRKSQPRVGCPKRFKPWPAPMLPQPEQGFSTPT